MAGTSKTEIAEAIRSAMDSKQLPEPEPGAMSYMLSKQQYLNDGAKNWRPHLMWFIPGDVPNSWGAGLAGSPILADKDSEDRMTIFMVPVGHWSDGTPAPSCGDRTVLSFDSAALVLRLGLACTAPRYAFLTAVRFISNNCRK
jgi:hypothetical protein